MGLGDASWRLGEGRMELRATVLLVVFWVIGGCVCSLGEAVGFVAAEFGCCGESGKGK